MSKSVSFDVLGTCFHFDPLIEQISQILARDPSSKIDATSLFHSWFYAAQRDFTYLSLSNSYTPIIQILTSTFRRACLIVGLTLAISDEDIASLKHGLQNLPARPHLGACFNGLREAGYDVYAVTNGGRASLNYFRNAGVELDEEHLLSCDDLKVAKPDARVYTNTVSRLEKNGVAEDRWFVAAHSWDLVAARNAGFRTAWVAHEEGDACEEIFGQFDVKAKDLGECLEMIKAAK